MLVRRLLGALAVCVGSIAFMAIGLKAMTPEDHVYVYDSKTGAKYKVPRENYTKHEQTKRERFLRRKEEMHRRNQGYVTEDEYRTHRTVSNSVARYKSSRAQRHQRMLYGNSKSVAHDPRDDERVQMMKLR
jgi:hypothetical protein